MSSVEDKFLNEWSNGTHRVFYYYTYMYKKPDIVILKRENKDLFTCNASKSTTGLQPMTRSEIYNILCSSRLVFLKDGEAWKDYRSEANPKGCSCGAWKTEFPKQHYDWCDVKTSKNMGLWGVHCED